MAENGRFDPMVLESRLHYDTETLEKTPLVLRAEATVVEEDSCMEITEAGVKGSSPLDLRQSPEHGDGTGTQVGDDHWRGTLTQRIGNGRTIPLAQQEEERPVLNPPSKGSKKRKNWTEAETDLLLEAVDSEKAKPRSRLDNELLWEGVARGVPGRTEKKCRMRMETLKKSYNAVKEYCDKEKKEFVELKGADFGKMKLAARIIDRWYYRIRDHCPPRATKKSREQGRGSCSSSVSTDVATRRGRLGVSQITAAAGVVAAEWRQEQRSMEWATWRSVNNRFQVGETTWSSDFGVDVSMVWIIWLRTMGNESVRKCRPSGFGNTKRQSG